MSQQYPLDSITKGSPLSAQDYRLTLPRFSLAALLAEEYTYSEIAAGSVFLVLDGGWRYKVAASDATNHHLTTAGGLKLYVLPTDTGHLPVNAFGAVADNATDLHPFIDAAITASDAGRIPIVFGSGTYYCGQTIELKVPARLVGAGNGTGLNQGTRLRFPVNVPGIRCDTRGAWRNKRLYRFETNSGLLSGGNATFFGLPLNYEPPTKAYPYAEVGAHVVCLTGEYYIVADPSAEDHTHTSAGVKLYLQADPEYVPDPTNQAHGGSIENMVLQGGGTDNEDRTCHGIKLQTAVRLVNVRVEYFGGDGVHISATVDGNYLAGDIYGNANNFALYNLTSRYNGRDGLYVQGADANAGDVFELDIALNARYGINERSFLGNNYFGCHLDGNGSPGNMGAVPGGNGANQTSTVTLGGKRYGPHPLASLQQLVDTSPDDTTPVLPVVEGGTASLPVWIEIGAPGSGYARAWEPDQPEGTYVLGGSYIALRATQRNTFYGCYDESGGAGCYISGNNMIFGGILGERMRGGQVTGTDGNRLRIDRLTVVGEGMTRIYGGDGTLGPILRTFSGPDEAQPWRESLYQGDYILTHQNSLTRMAWYMTGENTERQFGTGAVVRYIMGFNVLALGSGGSARRHQTLAAMPTTGVWARGDIVWNRDPSAAGIAGWMCTTAGTDTAAKWSPIALGAEIS